jgi:hypothetical protein
LPRTSASSCYTRYALAFCFEICTAEFWFSNSPSTHLMRNVFRSRTFSPDSRSRSAP